MLSDAALARALDRLQQRAALQVYTMAASREALIDWATAVVHELANPLTLTHPSDLTDLWANTLAAAEKLNDHSIPATLRAALLPALSESPAVAATVRDVITNVAALPSGSSAAMVRDAARASIVVGLPETIPPPVEPTPLPPATPAKEKDHVRELMLAAIAAGVGAGIMASIATPHKRAAAKFPATAEQATEQLSTVYKNATNTDPPRSVPKGSPTSPVQVASITETDAEALTGQWDNKTALQLATASQLRTQWFAVGDSHTRPSHMAVNGETVPAGIPFVIGGYRLMYPGDASLGAPAEITANCRCIILEA